MLRSLTALTLLTAGTVFSQTSIIVGEGTGSGTFAPVASWYESSATESIYTKTEIGVAGTITKLAFQKASGSNTTEPAVKIYLKNTTTATLSADYSIGTAGLSAYTLVYEGTLPNSFTSGWAEVTLQTPYVYDTPQNLSLLVTGSTCIESGRPQYRYTTTSGSKMSAGYNDGSIGCGGNSPFVATSTLKPVWERPNAKFTFGTLSNEVIKAAEVAISTSESSITIKTAVAPIASVQVFDLQGRLIASAQGINTKEFTIDTLARTNSMVIVKVQDTENRVISKKTLY